VPRGPRGAGGGEQEQARGDGERGDRADVQDQPRAERAAGQHRGDHEHPAGERHVAPLPGPGVGADPGQRHGQHGRGEVGHGELAGRRVLDPHRHRQQQGQRVGDESAERVTGCGGDDQGHDDQGQFRGGRGAQVNRAVAAHPAGEHPAERGADQEAGQREQRGAEREPGRPDEGEPGEHHVAGHVGHEDPAKRQDGHRVD
jgi:hypothetical protein